MMLEGVIRWFCNSSGEGMVSATDGQDYYLHWSAVKGKFPAANGKRRWVSLEPGWKIKFEPYQHQVADLRIVEKCASPETHSFYFDRDVMKAKLTAVYAMFDEIFPNTTMDWDEFRFLSNKNKLSVKERKRLDGIVAEKDRYNDELKRWNNEKSAVIVSIYREHSRFLWSLKKEIFL